ncbi:hypothetical protein Neosp_013318 [[Neocosmospora] mangrovei]
MAPSKASERAKAKLQAVLDNPNRNDASGYKQRVMTTKNPMGSGDINMVSRRDSNTRRMSTTSEGSAGEVQRRWSMVKNWINRPAY